VSPASTPVVAALDTAAWGTAAVLAVVVLVVVVMAVLGLRHDRPRPRPHRSLPAAAPAATGPPPEQASDHTP